jgi:site-specific DNA-methyltransferase (adenine-specific)
MAGGANKEKKIHPTQKPVEVYTELLNKFAKPGHKILDTHAGSASSLVAAFRGGYGFIGFEIGEEYHRTATERLEVERSQISIF